MQAILNENHYLENWVNSFFENPTYHQLTERFRNTFGCITHPTETAMIYALIQKLKPKISLEIGSFFGSTTKIMAQALEENKIEGLLVTIDPFGQDRVPKILESWPKQLQSLVDFKPWNSMQYFLELETLGKTRKNYPIGIAFVDGHHNFEYALFDIIRTADHLIIGGAIIVDNLEQLGPKRAVEQFVQWNPAWKLIIREPSKNVMWGILISPPGLQVGKNTHKIMKRNISERSIQHISFNSDYITHPGILTINMNYYAMPHDFHITGEGITQSTMGKQIIVSDVNKSIELDFNPKLLCSTDRSDINIGYELELSYLSDFSDQAYILLNDERPVILS